MNQKEYREFVHRLKPYIEKLKIENKEEKLVEAFQKYYPKTSVSYSYINSVISKLHFKKESSDGISWRIFKLTDYDCVLTDDFANLDDRADDINPEKVKSIYINFMNKNFSDYSDKMTEYLNEHQSNTGISI